MRRSASPSAALARRRILTDTNGDGIADNSWRAPLSVVEGDATPGALGFVDQVDVEPETVITSAPITVSGINVPAAISIVGGTYNKNGGSYTASAGTVVNGDVVRVRHTSSADPETAVNTVLTIGGVSDTFTSTTAAEEGGPEWLPDGAEGIIDFQAAQYYISGEERAIGDLFTGHDPDDITAAGSTTTTANSNRPVGTALLRSAVQGKIIVVQFADGSDGLLEIANAAEYGSATNVFGATITNSGTQATTGDWNESANLAYGSPTPPIKFALEFYVDIGGGDYRYGGSFKGAAANTWTTETPITAARLLVGWSEDWGKNDSVVQRLVIYPAGHAALASLAAP